MNTESVNHEQDLNQIWENRSRAYNSIFDYLKEKGLKERELSEFAKLLRAYLKSI